MTETPEGKIGNLQSIERADFHTIFDVLTERGYRLVGPRVREGVIVYDDLTSVDDLPIGYTDEQEKGIYRLRKGSRPALFGCGLGPHSWKKYVYPAEFPLWQAHRHNGSFEIIPPEHEPQQLALIGVRACELHALAILEQVFAKGMYRDLAYQTQRDRLFIVAVNCGQAGRTCFCASMNTGPQVSAGYDLALTEVLESERHYFVVEAGSNTGLEVVNSVPHQPASDAEANAAAQIVAQTAAQMGRVVDVRGLKEVLYANFDHPQWDKVAARCLSCANCTQVCPTCFCTTVDDVLNLTGDTAERRQRWDSCFTMDYSYIVGGGSIRASVKSRYRQWMTHKLATWIDQFGSPGCVGCGRCITWCPVGIDITEQINAIRAQNKIGSTPFGKEERT